VAEVAGFTYWELEFDDNGQPVSPQALASCAREAAEQGVTDLFVFSHGWNNAPHKARALYDQFFSSARNVLDARSIEANRKPAVAGVIWPSILFPDDEPMGVVPDAASVDASDSADAIGELRKAFPEHGGVLDELATLLEEQPESTDALDRFQSLLGELAPEVASDEDADDAAVLDEPAEKVFASLSELAPPGERTDAAGIGDAFSKLWTGAKEALRVTTYWNMKERAGVVGERGLAAFITQLDAAARGVRVHLIGHSFGARVVSFALKGLPAAFTGERSPVKSVTLIQGAFSHFAFASALPHDPNRSGALNQMASRVDGPILVTHSVHDLAVCQRYPQASFIARQDAADADDTRFRFGAMGADGAQAVEAVAVDFGPVGERYRFAKGRFLNLNGDELITRGDPPSGAHSDIFYPEIAWAVFHAAGVAR
jgi:hypothetical protein